MNSIQSFGHSMLHYITDGVAEAGKTLTEKVKRLSSYIQLLAVGYQNEANGTSDTQFAISESMQGKLERLLQKATTPGQMNKKEAISIIQDEFNTPQEQTRCANS